MIFITVGTDQPFDRLVKVVDHWVRRTGRADVVAQIGKGGWRPESMRAVEFIEPPEFTRYLLQADVVISHAGMGTILSALHHGKPLLVMPKLASLGEHRNDHQTATARKMMAIHGVNVAFNEVELARNLDHLSELEAPHKIGHSASESLLAGLRDFIFR
ncbi:MAG: glycosyltransferase [Akkermansiaceae bacterium]|jgi:UDP-N-acetylglucosamine transferase subunit ALG13|nr:glycosyltransferase [Akkermansiaceae bacterium]